MHRIMILRLALPLLVFATGTQAGAQQPVDADVLLQQGIIHDGTGGEPVIGDIAIRDDRIVAIGTFPIGTVKQAIPCKGLVIAPGFIDLHNHSDRQIVDRLTRANVNFLMQGCTTIVTGNCGGGAVDVGEYFEQIDSAGAGSNVVHLLPQGALRNKVMGTAQREATADELTSMQKLTEQAMQDGAFGMSTGLIYVPSTYADTAELIALARIVGQNGGIYASHIRNESLELLAAVQEALEIGRQAKLPVHISHFKSSGRDAWGLVREAARMIETARQEGQTVTADQYPYIASSTSLEATLIPPWARAGGSKALIERLDDAEIGARLREEMVENLKRKDGGEALQIAYYAPRPDWIGRRLTDIARAEKRSPLEVAEMITRNGGASIVNFSMNEEDVRHIMQIPWVATASDGRAYVPNATQPHPRNYGTFPRKIGVYALQAETLSLAQAIRSASGLPADILDLPDRGYLREGAFADLVVFDPQQIRDRATFDQPHQYCEGIAYVFVNGSPAVADGMPTGALAGRALRHTADSSKK